MSRYLSDTELLAAFFMVIGYFCRKSNMKFVELLPIIPIGAGIVAIGTAFWPCAMLKLEWMKVVPYAFSALAGTLTTFSLCKLLINKRFDYLAKILSYVGDKTLEILTWHFLCFKICSLVIITVFALPLARLAEFPVIEEYAYQGWWSLYFIIGTIMSLLIAFALNKINEITKKISNCTTKKCIKKGSY